MAAVTVTDLGERSVLELSIGERSRVALARALAVEAPVLLADEPTAMLDPHHQLAIMAELRAYAHGGQRLVVAVLHDLTLAARFCDRIVVIDHGTVVVDDSSERALTAEILERRYRIAAHFGHYEGERLIVPWRPLV
jgi:iron complex transport system ATP-binding protein